MFVWLEKIFDRMIFDFFGFQEGDRLWQILHFFMYDSTKIIILLVVVIYVMTLVNSYVPIEKIKKFLTKKQRYWLDHFFAAVFGAITPFCSCSSIPLFIGFLKWGIPLGTTLSFLITSPLINEIAIAMLLGIFWSKITFLYIGSGIALGTIAWFVLWKMWLEKHLDASILEAKKEVQTPTKVHFSCSNFREKLSKTYQQTIRITKRVIPYVLLGVFIGAAIHNFVPMSIFETQIIKNKILSVPFAVILWIPLYANATSIIPIIQALIAKWIPLWTGLAFMMASVGLSLPEFLMLKRIMNLQFLMILFMTVGVCIVGIWYFFNRIL